jgi:hypothetical protein
MKDKIISKYFCNLNEDLVTDVKTVGAVNVAEIVDIE